jgi:hypothetical protein
MFLQCIHLLRALPSSGRGKSNLFRKLFALLVIPASVVALWAMPRNAHAQLYVTNLPVVSQYDPTTGAVISASFITGLNVPFGLGLKGNTLFVTNFFGNTVGKYNATTGAAISPTFITGLDLPTGVALSGNTLFVTNLDEIFGGGTVGKYDAKTGAAINANFITGLSGPEGGLALKGNTLFVADSSVNRVGAYDATTGAVINANFITGLNEPAGIAVKIAN